MTPTPAQLHDVACVAVTGLGLGLYLAACWAGDRRARPARDAAFDATCHTDHDPKSETP